MLIPWVSGLWRFSFLRHSILPGRTIIVHRRPAFVRAVVAPHQGRDQKAPSLVAQGVFRAAVVFPREYVEHAKEQSVFHLCPTFIGVFEPYIAPAVFEQAKQPPCMAAHLRVGRRQSRFVLLRVQPLQNVLRATAGQGMPCEQIKREHMANGRFRAGHAHGMQIA